MVIVESRGFELINFIDMDRLIFNVVAFNLREVESPPLDYISIRKTPRCQSSPKTWLPVARHDPATLWRPTLASRDDYSNDRDALLSLMAEAAVITAVLAPT
jgi:hypothetical protein